MNPKSGFGRRRRRGRDPIKFISPETPNVPTIETALDLKSPQADANAAAMWELVADLRKAVERARIGGGEDARNRHRSRGKLLPRDRVDAARTNGMAFYYP